MATWPWQPVPAAVAAEHLLPTAEETQALRQMLEVDDPGWCPPAGRPEQALVGVLAGAVDPARPGAPLGRMWVTDAVRLLRAHPDLDWEAVPPLLAGRRRAVAGYIQLTHLGHVYGVDLPQPAYVALRDGAAGASRAEGRELRRRAAADGAEVRPEPRARLRSIPGRLWVGRSLVLGRLRPVHDAVLYTGEGNVPGNERTYRCLADLPSGQSTGTLLSAQACRHLLVQNHVDPRFDDWPGPKLLFSLEPDDTRPDRIAGERERPEVRPFLMSFSDPDPDRRLHYPTLPWDRQPFIARLRADLHERRPHLATMVAAFNDAPGQDLLPFRRDYAHALGAELQIFGRTQTTGPGWRTYPGYRGPVTQKLTAVRTGTFNVCFENSERPGYITEKILEAFLGGAIPLYWGGGGREREVLPAAAYLDCRDRDPAEVVAEVRAMGHDEVVARRQVAMEWLSSAAADRFTWRGFTAQVTTRLRAQRG
jgi:hypothetical protein